MEAPKQSDFLIEEEKLADALIKVLTKDSYRVNLDRHRTQLLKKFDLDTVAKQYLIEI